MGMARTGIALFTGLALVTAGCDTGAAMTFRDAVGWESSPTSNVGEGNLGEDKAFAGSPPEAALVAAITLTPEAAAEVRRVIEEQEMEEPVYLRYQVLPGGCSGFTHALGFDSEMTVWDQLSEPEGLRLLIPKRQADILDGTIIDFQIRADRQGFVIKIPVFEGPDKQRWIEELERREKTSKK